MKPLKLKAELALFWAPLLFSLLLNPGGGGSNIATFSRTKLWALFLCGVISAICILVLFLQPKQLIKQHEITTMGTWFKYIIFAIFMASFDLGFSISALLKT